MGKKLLGITSLAMRKTSWHNETWGFSRHGQTQLNLGYANGAKLEDRRKTEKTGRRGTGRHHDYYCYWPQNATTPQKTTKASACNHNGQQRCGLRQRGCEAAEVVSERARTRIRITRTQSERSAFANARSRTRVSRTRVSRTHERTRTRVRTQLSRVCNWYVTEYERVENSNFDNYVDS